MRRRKKVLIACAALAVVVVCALALMTRPMQFEFLRDAKVESVLFTSYSHGPEGVWVETEYELDRTITEFIEWARKELTPEKGWHWSDGPPLFKGLGTGPIVENAREQTVLWFGQPSGSEAPPSQWQRPVAIQVLRPANSLERLRYWVGER